MLQKCPVFAYIPAKNVTRAREFYEQTLGFTPAREVAGGVTYECEEGTACFLYPTPNAGTSKASQAFWEVADLEREVADLKARGVRFEEYDMVRGGSLARGLRRRLESQLIDITPAPVLARLETAHDRMLGLVKVLGGVTVGGIVAAADVTAFETEPQMHPLVAALQAFFAPVRRLRRNVVHLGKMFALLGHTVVP